MKPIRRRGLKKTASPLLLSGLFLTEPSGSFSGYPGGISEFLRRGWIKGAASFVINLNGR